METKPPIPPFTIETARQKVRLVFDDVAGNNFFNTLGNIVSDPRVSLLFIDFDSGRQLRITGHAALVAPMAATQVRVRVRVQGTTLIELRWPLGGTGLALLVLRHRRNLSGSAVSRPPPIHRGIQMTLLRLTSLVALTFCASFAQAQSTAPKELSALLASQAAAEALTSCDKLGHKVSVTVLDRNGLTRAVLKHERATPHTLDSSRGKAYTIVTLGPIFKKDLQSELVAQLAANPAAAALTSVPGILVLPGAVLIKSGDEVIGSIGVGGAPSGLVDEGCAKAGLEKIASSLK
jgi:uncharacterized protein GlcG (DUF336 family)